MAVARVQVIYWYLGAMVCESVSLNVFAAAY